MLRETWSGSSLCRLLATRWMPTAISCAMSVSRCCGMATASHRSAMSLTVPEIHPSSGHRIASSFLPRENTAYCITNGVPSMPRVLSRSSNSLSAHDLTSSGSLTATAADIALSDISGCSPSLATASDEGSVLISVSIATGNEVSGWIRTSGLRLLYSEIDPVRSATIVFGSFRQLTRRLRSACARWKLKVASCSLGPVVRAGTSFMVG